MSADPSCPAVVRLPVLRIEQAQARPEQDWVSAEVPVEIHLDAMPFAVMMTSPGDWLDFAHGFVRSEGLLAAGARIIDIEVQERLEGMYLHVRTTGLSERAQPRRLPARTGCGVCGSQQLEHVLQQPPPILAEPRLTVPALEQALAALRRAQAHGQLSGSLHAAAWCSLEGELQLVREDVGRHNALDKLLGAIWRQGDSVAAGFLLVTSRASHEMVSKAAQAGIALMAAISAPTALAVRLADSARLTLIGFARPGRCMVYTQPHRFLLPATADGTA